MGYESTELRKFTEVGHAIAKSANVSFQTWARGEMGVVLKMWAARTPVISEAKSAVEARSKASKQAGTQRASKGGISVNTGERGGRAGLVWFRTRNDHWQDAGSVSDSGTYSATWTHWKASDFENITKLAEKFGTEVSKLIPAGKKAIGLARQSVVQIADALHIPLESVQGGTLTGGDINKARNAMASNGMTYQNGKGTETKGGAGVYSIEAVNSYPLNGVMKMDIALMSVLQTRIRTYENNIVRGVFRDLKSVAQAYPYIKVA